MAGGQDLLGRLRLRDAFLQINCMILYFYFSFSYLVMSELVYHRVYKITKYKMQKIAKNDYPRVAHFNP